MSLPSAQIADTPATVRLLLGSQDRRQGGALLLIQQPRQPGGSPQHVNLVEQRLLIVFPAQKPAQQPKILLNFWVVLIIVRRPSNRDRRQQRAFLLGLIRFPGSELEVLPVPR